MAEDDRPPNPFLTGLHTRTNVQAEQLRGLLTNLASNNPVRFSIYLEIS